MKTYYLNQLSGKELNNLCQREAINLEDIFPAVKKVLSDVKARGDQAVAEYTRKFDGVEVNSFSVTQQEIDDACKRIPPDVKRAFEVAASNIEKFHLTQIGKRVEVETTPGVTCFAEMRPIERIGLYIPGGSAPLPSTALMLAIPAKLAGCKEVVLCTPPQNDGSAPDVILYAANLCGVTRIFKIGGAQAIAAMGYGSQSVPKVDKIFGPGNQYVVAAKMLVSVDPKGAAIDLPAGPTEVLVVADEDARADFVASDLLSQAEHGADSQVVLVSSSEQKAKEVLIEVEDQLQSLPREAIAAAALEKSFALIVDSIPKAIEFANRYAPEHMILNVAEAERYVSNVVNAGSVFLGPYSCESAGDYASGTNHTLPTSGYARAYSGVSVSSFQKQVTFQVITRDGARLLGPSVSRLAEVETLDGHKRAMEIRYSDKASEENL